jgi:hypothetical protein
MKTLLVNGYSVFYDESDSDAIKGKKWCVYTYGRGKIKKQYVTAYENGENIYMHRLLMDARQSEQVDHINMNGLDNRRSNLRIATKSQNSANKPSYGGSSKYKGVCKAKTKSPRWRAWVQERGKSIYLGSFKSEKEAADAYDVAAQKIWGAFAHLNAV